MGRKVRRDQEANAPRALPGDEEIEELLTSLRGLQQLSPTEHRRYLRLLEPKAMRVLDRLLGNPYVRPDVRAKIAQDILDRLHGKAVQPVEDAEVRKKLEQMSDEELARYVLEATGLAGRMQIVPIASKGDESVH